MSRTSVEGDEAAIHPAGTARIADERFACGAALRKKCRTRYNDKSLGAGIEAGKNLARHEFLRTLADGRNSSQPKQQRIS